MQGLLDVIPDAVRFRESEGQKATRNVLIRNVSVQELQVSIDPPASPFHVVRGAERVGKAISMTPGETLGIQLMLDRTEMTGQPLLCDFLVVRIDMCRPMGVELVAITGDPPEDRVQQVIKESRDACEALKWKFNGANGANEKAAVAVEEAPSPFLGNHNGQSGDISSVLADFLGEPPSSAALGGGSAGQPYPAASSSAEVTFSRADVTSRMATPQTGRDSNSNEYTLLPESHDGAGSPGGSTGSGAKSPGSAQRPPPLPSAPSGSSGATSSSKVAAVKPAPDPGMAAMLADFLGEAPSAAALQRAGTGTPSAMNPPLRRSEARRRKTDSPADSPRNDAPPRSGDFDDDRPPTPKPGAAEEFGAARQSVPTRSTPSSNQPLGIPAPANDWLAEQKEFATVSSARVPPRPRAPSRQGSQGSSRRDSKSPRADAGGIPSDPDAFFVEGVGWCDSMGRIIAPDSGAATKPSRASSLPRRAPQAVKTGLGFGSSEDLGRIRGRAASQPKRQGHGGTQKKVDPRDLEDAWNSLGGI